MFPKMVGGILLIVGTSIGAGMIALPVVTAQAGFVDALLLLFTVWLLTLIAALYILEVNLWLPESSNLISMARVTLGRWGQGFTWLVYLLLLYSLLSAYVAAGADLLHYLFALTDVATPAWFDTLLFTFIFGSIVFLGIRTIDWTNRGLMTVKLLAFLSLVFLVVHHVHPHYLLNGHYQALSSALLVIVTSFGYATVVPSLRAYFKGNVRVLRLIIVVGSIVSLICYLLWELVVLGSLPSKAFTAVVQSGNTASQLTAVLSHTFSSPKIQEITRLFSSVCVTTSFLGVSLCLCDFLKDGLSAIWRFRISKKLMLRHVLPVMLALGPPLFIVLIKPALFIVGLRFAGICCVLLLLVLPAAMVYRGRYRAHNELLSSSVIDSSYRVWGGRSLVISVILLSVVLCIYGVTRFWSF